MNVYDFDGTIYDGDSAIDFFLFTLKRNLLLIKYFPIQILGLVAYIFGIIPRDKMKEQFFSFIKGIKNLDEEVDYFWENKEYKIKRWYLDQQKKNDIIISASPFFLLNPICIKLNIQTLIASNLDKRTVKFVGRNCQGKEKVRRFNNKFKNLTIDNFYTDSLSDEPLISIAKRSFIVKRNKIIDYKIYEKTMKYKIKKMFFNKGFIIFVFCGGVGTLTNFLVSLFISNYINATISYVVGYSISLFITYYLNIKLLFKREIALLDFIKFIISYIPNFIILFTFVAIFLNIFHWQKIIVYALAGLLGIPITYILVKIYALVGDKNDKDNL